MSRRFGTYSTYEVKGSELIDLACMADSEERWKLVDKIVNRKPKISLNPARNPIVAGILVAVTMFVLGSIIGHVMEAIIP